MCEEQRELLANMHRAHEHERKQLAARIDQLQTEYGVCQRLLEEQRQVSYDMQQEALNLRAKLQNYERSPGNPNSESGYSSLEKQLRECSREQGAPEIDPAVSSDKELAALISKYRARAGRR